MNGWILKSFVIHGYTNEITTETIATLKSHIYALKLWSDLEVKL